MSDYKLEAREVTDRARGQWDRIFARLAPQLGTALENMGRHVSCPVHGGTDGFRFHRHKGVEFGMGVCNTCKEFIHHGERKYLGGLGILVWVTERTFVQVLNDVAEIVAPDLLRKDRRPTAHRPAPKPYVPPPRTQKQIDDARALVQRMRDVWNQGVPISSVEARRAWGYFESRGLPVPTEKDGLDSTLRFVPSLYYSYDRSTGDSERYPAIIALVKNQAGKTREVLRTFLSWNDCGKAPVEQPKKLMKLPDDVSLATCAIRLGPPSRVIAIAEGMETAMAVRAFTGFTCWSTVNATLLRQFLPPEGTRAVHIFADLDRSEEGEKSAKAAREHLLARGYQVRVDPPPGPIPVGSKGVDWLDLYQRYGSETIQLVGSLKQALANRKVIPFPINARRAG